MRLEEQTRTGKVYSFDAGKCADHVIQTDIAAVPLKSGSVDIVVFSLSLMGTNFPDFLHEANRVLKLNGLVFIAERLRRWSRTVL